MNIRDYCIRVGGVQWPICPGTGELVNYTIRSGKGLVLCRYTRFHGANASNSEAMRAKAAKVALRTGAANPCYGKPSWMKGKTADTDPRVAKIAEKRRGAKRTPEMRKRMSDAHRARWENATPEQREHMGNQQRLNVAKARAAGAFDQVTSIHKAMRGYLQGLCLAEPFTEEHQIGFYVVDFAFPKARLAIECDGDYFHCNPAFYPNGPRTATQARNVKRVAFREAYLKREGWTVIHVWECDINAGSFKEPLQCRLSESGLLSPSAASAA